MATTKKKSSASKASTSKNTKAKSTQTKSTASKATSAKRKSSSTADKSIIARNLRKLKSTSWLAVLESLVVGAFGLLLIFRADEVKSFIFNVIGIFLVVKGAYKIINYFAVHGKYNYYNNDLLYGVVALVLGIIAVAFQSTINDAIGIIVGAWMIYGSLVRLNTAIKLQAAGVKAWFYVLIFALVMMALGIYCLVSVSEGWSDILGWIMIGAAVVGIIDDILFMRHIDQLAE